MPAALAQVNAPPQATNLSAGEVYTEDTTLNLTDIVVSDPDSPAVTATLTLSNSSAGSLTTATSGVVTSTFSAGVWSASGSLANVNALLAGVSFVPAANFNASFSIATSVSDGVAAPITGFKSMTGVAVNDAPQATNLSAGEVYTEDTTLNLTDIVVSDPDSPAVTATLTLSNSSAGSLTTGTSGATTSTFSAGVWSASGSIANVNALLAGVSFVPATNFNASFSIATSVSDGVASPVTGFKSMTGVAVNDAPQATNLSAGEVYTEDTTLNLTDIVVSDPDNTSTTATLTLSNPAAGSLTTATSGTVTSTFSAGVWSASGAITDVNALLAGVSFVPAANFNASFSIATSVSDGVASPVTGSKTMTGIAVNDAPQATNLSAGEVYTEDTTLNLTDIVVSDPDNTSTTATLTLSNPAAGSLTTATSGAVTSTFSAGVWSASGSIANVNALLAGVSFVPAANFNASFIIATSVSDGVASPVTGSKAMTGVAVNDAPVLDASKSPSLDAVLQDALSPVGAVGTLVSSLVDFTSPAGQVDNVSDVDAAAQLGIALVAADVTSGQWFYSTTDGSTWLPLGTVSNAGALLLVANLNTRLYFRPNPAFSGTVSNAITFRAWDRTSGANGTVASTVSNGGTTAFSAATDGADIIVVHVNAPPQATNLSAAEVYTEDTTLNLTDIVVSDPDNTSTTATLTLSNPAAGSVTTATSGTVTSTFSAGVWSASGAITDVNALLAGVSFVPAANFNASFTLATSVSDGLASPVTGSKTMTGIAVNDAPQATNLSAGEVYTEDTTLNLTDIVVSDPDSPAVTASLTLSNPSAGSLTTATSGAVTSTFSAGVWSASGAITDVNALLAGVSFVPAANFNASFIIATSVSDGVASPVTGSKSMTGVAVNTPPQATNLSAGEVYTEDTTLDLTDIVVSDPDSPAVTASLTLSNPSAGSLTTATSGATTSTFSAGVWSASGSIADVNTLLAGVSFVPAANFNASFSIATSVSDGVASPVTGSKSMTGVAVNDAPVLDSSKSPALDAVLQDAPSPVGAVGTLVSSLVDFAAPGGQLDNVSDVDAAAQLGIALIAADVTSGQWFFSTTDGSSWFPLGAVSDASALLLAANLNTRLYFRPNPGFFGTVSNAIAFRAWDLTSGANGSTASTVSNGGTTAFSLATDGAGITVNATTDADGSGAPLEFALTRAGANPSTGTIVLRFSIPAASHVAMSLVDVQGRKVASMIDADYAAGSYPVRWNARSSGSSLATGIYYVRLVTAQGTRICKVVIAR